MVLPLRPKPSGLYRHQGYLGLHMVGCHQGVNMLATLKFLGGDAKSSEVSCWSTRSLVVRPFFDELERPIKTDHERQVGCVRTSVIRDTLTHVKIIATANPTPNPNPAKRNSTMSIDTFLGWRRTVSGVMLLHALDTWNPHRPMFPKDERSENVKKWEDSGTLPRSWL